MRFSAFAFALLLSQSWLFAYVALLEGANSSAAAPEIWVDSPSNSQTTDNRNMTFIFTYYKRDSAISEPMCALYLNGTMHSSTRAKSDAKTNFIATNLQRSQYTWQIFCEETKTDIHTFTVSKLPPPEISLRSPPGGVNLEISQQPQFSFVYYSREDELPSTTCRLAIGAFVRAEGLARDGESLTLALSGGNFTPGTYSWSVQCDRPAGKEKLNSEQRVFFIKAPKAIKNTTIAPPAHQNETVAPLVTYHISLDPSGTEGKPFSLMLVGSDGKPKSGVEITVSPSGGPSFSAGKTDALGRVSFTPKTSGAHSILAAGVALEQNYSVEISSAAKEEIPESQTPSEPIKPSSQPAEKNSAEPKQADANTKNKTPAEPSQSTPAQQDNSLLLIGGAVALLAVVAVVGALLLLKKPGAPPKN